MLHHYKSLSHHPITKALIKKNILFIIIKLRQFEILKDSFVLIGN